MVGSLTAERRKGPRRSGQPRTHALRQSCGARVLSCRTVFDWRQTPRFATPTAESTASWPVTGTGSSWRSSDSGRLRTAGGGLEPCGMRSSPYLQSAGKTDHFEGLISWGVGGVGGSDALAGTRPQRGAQKRLGRRLEAVAKAVGGGYCRIQMPLKLALAIRETVAGHRLGALDEGGGGGLPPPPFQCIPGGGNTDRIALPAPMGVWTVRTSEPLFRPPSPTNLSPAAPVFRLGRKGGGRGGRAGGGGWTWSGLGEGPREGA